MHIYTCGIEQTARLTFGLHYNAIIVTFFSLIMRTKVDGNYPKLLEGIGLSVWSELYSLLHTKMVSQNFLYFI